MSKRALNALNEIIRRKESVGPETDPIRTMLEGSPVCTKIIDLQSRLQYMSSAGQKQLKITNINEYYGAVFPSEIYPPSWHRRLRDYLERSKKGEICSLECPVLDTDGNEVWYDTTFVPASDEQNKIQYIIVTSVDITERRRAEEQARIHREELAHVARVSTMSELATGIAHELNQPLAAISSYSFAARAIVDELPERSTKKLKEILEKLEDQSIRAGEIVRRVRDFIGKSNSPRELVCINTLVKDVAKFLEPDIRKEEIELKLYLANNITHARIDKIQVQQVLVNLIKNSIDAIKSGMTNLREIVVTTEVRNNCVEVLVSDTGKGIQNAQINQLFNAFFSTKSGGIGMGLPISRSIIEAHGGNLWSRPNQDIGATFGFSLPIGGDQNAEEQPIVFLVDDEETIRESLSVVVESIGFSARCFSDAIEFLDYVEEFGIQRPSCLIVDIQMPKIGGLDLLKQLNSNNFAIQTIVITGHGTVALKRRARELGVTAFLEKPFRPSLLRDHILDCFVGPRNDG